MRARIGTFPLVVASGLSFLLGGCSSVVGVNNNPAPSSPTTPSVTVTASAASFTIVQSILATVKVSGSGAAPTGTVTLTSGSYSSSATTLSAGSATIQIGAGVLATGTDTLSASYAPDSASSSSYNSASGSADVTVTKATPLVTVTPASAHVLPGQDAVISVAVSGGTGAPGVTGSVTMTTGAYTSSATALASGSASVTIPGSALASGSNTITAAYTPDTAAAGVYDAASGSTAVTIMSTPSVTVTPSAASITTVQSVSATVKVSGSGAAPTGTVTLTSGSYSSSATTLSAGSATIQIGAGVLASGTDTLSASYAPDSASSSSYKSASGSASVTVSKATPTVRVTPASANMLPGQDAVISVAVSGGTGAPGATGSVAVTTGTYTSAATALASGSASVTIPASALASGSNTITAAYTPDTAAARVYGAASGSSAVTISMIAPTVTVTPSATKITPAGTLTATVQVSGGSGAPVVTGSVVVTAGTYTSSVTALASGAATVTISASALANGSNTITAAYTPDTAAAKDYDTASGFTAVTVAAITPMVTVTPASASIDTQTPVKVTITVDGGAGNPTPTGSVVLTSGTFASSAVVTGVAPQTNSDYVNIFGDSVAEGSGDYTRLGAGCRLANSIGMKCNAFGVSGQALEQTCARMGLCPTSVQIVGGVIPSGPNCSFQVTWTSGYEGAFHATSTVPSNANAPAPYNDPKNGGVWGTIEVGGTSYDIQTVDGHAVGSSWSYNEIYTATPLTCPSSPVPASGTYTWTPKLFDFMNGITIVEGGMFETGRGATKLEAAWDQIMASPDSSRFLIWPIGTYSYIISGSVAANTINEVNAYLASKYPNNYPIVNGQDLPTYIASQGTGTGLDAYFAGLNPKITPASLRPVLTNVTTLTSTISDTTSLGFALAASTLYSDITFNDGTSETICVSKMSGTTVASGVRGCGGSVAGTHSSGATVNGRDVGHGNSTYYADVARFLVASPQFEAILNPSMLSSGSITFTIPAGTLAAGIDTLTAAYTPDAGSTGEYAAATGSAAITVAKVTPKVTVTPAATTVPSDQDLKVTVAVPGLGDDLAPTGSIVVSSETYRSASAKLEAGSASVVIPAGSLLAGSATISAVYSPDSAGGANFNSASGTSVIQVFIVSTVTVNQGISGPKISDKLLGMNLADWYDPTDPAIVPAFHAAGIKAMRWPGGSWSDAYHWKTNSMCYSPSTGAPLQPGGWAHPNGVYLNIINDLQIAGGLDVALTANYGTDSSCTTGGDPQEAADWITYAEAHGGIVSHITVGNEEYGSWETDLHAKPHDAATYADAAATGYYPAIKAVDKNVPVGIVVTADSVTYPTWDSTVLSKAKYDFVEYHFYPQAPGSESDSYLVHKAAQDLSKNIDTIKAELKTAGNPDSPIYVGEIGSVYSSPGKQSWSITQGLYAGQTLGEMMNQGVSRLTWWIGFGDCSEDSSGRAIGNMSSFLYGWQTFGAYNVFSDGPTDGPCGVNSGPDGTMSPTARAFQLFSNVAVDGESVLSTTVAGDNTDVRAYAATHSGGTAIVLFNLNQTTQEPVKITLSGQSTSSGVRMITYSKAIYDKSNSNVWDPPTTTDLGSKTMPLSVWLPPWSMNVIIIQ